MKPITLLLLMLWLTHGAVAQNEAIVKTIDQHVATIENEINELREYESLLSYQLHTEDMVPGTGWQGHDYEFFYYDRQDVDENDPGKVFKYLTKVVCTYNVAASVDYRDVYYFKDGALVYTYEVWEGDACGDLHTWYDNGKMVKFKSVAVEDCYGEGTEDAEKTSGFDQYELNGSKYKLKTAKQLHQLFQQMVAVNGN